MLKNNCGRFLVMVLIFSVFGGVTVSSSFKYLEENYREILSLNTGDVYPVKEVQWNADSSLIAGLSRKGIYIWDTTTGELLTTINSEGLRSLAWSPNGLMVAGGGSVTGWDMDLPIGSYEGEVAWIWDSNSARLAKSFTVFYGSDDMPELSSIDWSPDGTFLAAGSLDGAIHLWNVQTTEDRGQPAPYLVLERIYYVNSVDWNSDGTKLAVADTYGVAIFDVDENGLNTDKSQRLLFDPVDINSLEETYEIAWHPEGKRLASVDIDNIIRVWDIATGQILLTFGNSDTVILSLEWHPDGEFLVTVSQNIDKSSVVSIWDGKSDQKPTNLPISNANYALWNPKGSQLAVGVDDGTISIWGTEP